MLLLIGKSQPRTDAQRNYNSPLFEIALVLVRYNHFVIAVWRPKAAQSVKVRYWEIIADNLSKAGWS